MRVNYPFRCLILMKFEFFRQIFEKSSNFKFHKNPLSGSRVVPCGRTDMTKLIVAFRNSAKMHLKISETNKMLWFETSVHLGLLYRSIPPNKYKDKYTTTYALLTHSSLGYNRTKITDN
jgi:hypothetical protein